MDKSALASRITGVVANVEKVIFGKHHEVELALVALVCRGHILVEDVPGTGKTGTAENAAGAPHGWFVGFAPAEAPVVAVAVIVENAAQGGVDAAPLGGRVMRSALGR